MFELALKNLSQITTKITSITSFWFFIFLGVGLLVYYIIPQKMRWVVLLLESTVFFIFACSLKLFLFFTAQVLLAWGSVLLAQKFKNKATFIVLCVILIEIAALVLYKDSNFFVINARLLSQLFGGSGNIEYLNLIAPFGMSYYTLMLVSYVLDTHWGKNEPQRNPLKLILYACFFPQMISGPFSRYNELASNLYDKKSFNYDGFLYGLQRFLWGLFKKLVLAERLAIIVHTIYNGGTETQMGTWTPTGVYIIIGAFAYVLQVYTDFSGCMDIVLGTAQMFGVKLPENFNTPFNSISLAEFWRRWHITLGAWARDYVMYPLLKSRFAQTIRNITKRFGKKASKNIVTYVATLIVWLIIGLWHGGAYKWLFWGVLTFIIIIGGMILQPIFNSLTKLLRINTDAWSWTLFRRIRTTCLFALTVSVQPAHSLSDALTLWKNAFIYNPWVLVDGSLFKLGLDVIDSFVLIFGLCVFGIVSSVQSKHGSVRDVISKQNLWFRWILWILLFVAVILFGIYGEGYNPSDFIYGGF